MSPAVLCSSLGSSSWCFVSRRYTAVECTASVSAKNALCVRECGVGVEDRVDDGQATTALGHSLGYKQMTKHLPARPPERVEEVSFVQATLRRLHAGYGVCRMA